MSTQEVEAIMPPAFAIRVRHAIGGPTSVAIRSHDGSGNL